MAFSMNKKLMFLISTEGKTKEQIKKEAGAALLKFQKEHKKAQLELKKKLHPQE